MVTDMTRDKVVLVIAETAYNARYQDSNFNNANSDEVAREMLISEKIVDALVKADLVVFPDDL